MSRRAEFLQLRLERPAVLPSLLMCDFGRLAEEVQRLDAAGADALHLDVMDGRFVPNMTYGLTIVQAVRKATDSLLDVHLMIVSPEEYVDRFVDAGANAVSVHYEATGESARDVLEQIRSRDAAAGLAFNPGTPIEAVEPLLDACDYVLVMSVQPGFGGQSFDRGGLAKLRRLRELQPEMTLEIDGGVDQATGAECAVAGADLLVAGSAVFGSADYTGNVAEIRASAAAASEAS